MVRQTRMRPLTAMLTFLLFSINYSIGYAQITFDCVDVTEISRAECEALVALYTTTAGDDWSEDITAGWLQTNTPCSWHGVDCVDDHVVGLYKPFSGLKGVVPAEIGDLTQLSMLDLSHNQLTMIPPEIGRLTRLQGLVLTDNWLSYIPAEIGQLSELDGLRVEYNHLTRLPPEIGNLSKLSFFDMSNNPIEAWPSEWTKLNLNGLIMVDVCTPRDPVLQAWLDTIPEVTRIGESELCPVSIQPIQPNRPSSSHIWLIIFAGIGLGLAIAIRSQDRQTSHTDLY